MVWPTIRQEIQSLDTLRRPAYYGAMSDTDKPSNKADIRRHHLTLRRALTHCEVNARSRAAAQRLCTHSTYLAARCVHVYVTGKDNELDARILLENALSAGKEVVVPIVGSHTLIPHPCVKIGHHAMACARIEHTDELNSAHWDISQPAPHTARWLDDWQRIDLAVVPGIAFDLRGQRIGYGAGFYDRLLSRLRAQRVGLCFEDQLCDHLPDDPHDIAMHWIVTEQSIYTGKNP